VGSNLSPRGATGLGVCRPSPVPVFPEDCAFLDNCAGLLGRGGYAALTPPYALIAGTVLRGSHPAKSPLVIRAFWHMFWGTDD
jgi:hypothetical protein